MANERPAVEVDFSPVITKIKEEHKETRKAITEVNTTIKDVVVANQDEIISGIAGMKKTMLGYATTELSYLTQINEEMKDIPAKITNEIRNSETNVITNILDSANTIITNIADYSNDVKSYLRREIGDVIDEIKDISIELNNSVKSIITEIGKNSESVKQTVIEKADTTVKDITNNINLAKSTIVTNIESGYKKITDGFTDIIDVLDKSIKNIISGITEFGGMIIEAQTLIMQAQFTWLQNLFKIDKKDVIEFMNFFQNSLIESISKQK